jgi:hypothetical protein
MQATREAPTLVTNANLRDRLAMIIMLIASLGAVIAFLGAVPTALDAGSSTVIVETWRTLGFLVFAGLFLLLALRPRHYPGLWELAILHKGGMAIIAALLISGNAADAGSIAAFDGVLVAMIIASYVLSKGYTSWQRW